MRAPSIAILGGGVSGLTLAYELVALGYDRIVIFERAAAVGGKACTVDIDGKPHDLGATMGVPIDYDGVLAFSRAANNPTRPFPVETHYSLATGQPVQLNRRRDLPRVLAQAAKYLALHAQLWHSQLHDADPSLFAPWRDLVARHGLELASRRTLCYRTGYGYGFDDEVPAVLYTNLLRPQTLLGLAVDNPFLWRDGTQPIWQALASRLSRHVEIRTSTTVTRLVRGDGVVVHSHGARARVERFDRVAITLDPQAALGILDASPIERRWFSQTRTYPYATFACEVDGLTAGRASVGYLDDNMRRDRAGHAMAWVKRHADQDIYVFHLFAPPALSDRAIEACLGGDVARLGGRLRAVRDARRWRFFPHFTSELMQSGGLAEIDRWQGDSGLYLLGEALSFSTMARVAELARDFAHRIARDPARTTTIAVPRFAS